jgi:triosephosphate isomerase (TIM)
LKIVAANFKTNHTRKLVNEYIVTVDGFIKDNNYNNDIYIFPSLTSLDRFDTSSNLNIGVQNAYNALKGSYTGEVGSLQLDEFDIKTILIGHSERREFFNEEQDLIVDKFKYYANLGYKIIYCIGEPLEVKEDGYEEILDYLFTQLEGIDILYDNLVIAYEPVWAIGTGAIASIEDIQNIHNSLKEKIEKPILYGGSVNVNNIENILSINSVDGVLVGSASLDKEDFCSMIKISNNI